MSAVTLFIPIEPQPWQRPKTRVILKKGTEKSKKGVMVTHYNSTKLKNYENLIADAYKTCPKSQYFDREQPLKVAIIFSMPIPQSYSKKRREWILKGFEQHTKRPDADNLGKAVIDALNGVAWADDSQIVQLTLRKEYAATEPQIWLSIQPFV